MKSLNGFKLFLAMVSCAGMVHAEIPYDASSQKDFEDNGVKWIRFDCSEGCVLNCYSGIAGDVSVPALLGGKRVLGFVPNVFRNCEFITSIVVPEGIVDIPTSAFRNCKSLTSVELPSTVTNLGEYAFSESDKITHIEIPGVKVIGACCFQECSGLKSIVLSTMVKEIGRAAFYNCRKLESITIPASITNIADLVFSRCVSLTNVTMMGDAPICADWIFENANRDLVVYVPVGSKGWDGNPESTALPKYWPFNTEGGRRIVHIGETVNDEPPVVTNYVYSTVTNYVFSTVTNEVFHYSTVTNEIFHYTTVTNVVKYVPEPGASPDAGYGINVGAGGETVIAGAAGWDAFGVPDGMEWNKETGTLSGRAKLSGAYDLILVSGSGADTKIMRTTLTVAPYDTIIGYVGVAFSQSGAPLDNLKSYKTLPAGLKWKSGKLSGVPTKKQTIKLATKDGEPVTIEIRALPTAAVGTFSGAVTDGSGGATTLPVGRVTLNVTSAGKISGKIYEGGRTWTLSAANFSSASVPTNGEFRVSGTATRTASKKTYKQPWTLVIAVDGGRGATALPGATIATGTFGETMTFEAQRNFWKDEGAGELIADWVGEYAWTAPDGGKLTLALNAAGTVKVTGKLGNGRALSLSFPLTYQNDERKVLIYAAPQTVNEKSGKKTVSKKYPEFIAVVKFVNEPGMSEAGGDIAYRYR